MGTSERDHHDVGPGLGDDPRRLVMIGEVDSMRDHTRWQRRGSPCGAHLESCSDPELGDPSSEEATATNNEHPYLGPPVHHAKLVLRSLGSLASIHDMGMTVQKIGYTRSMNTNVASSATAIEFWIDPI